MDPNALRTLHELVGGDREALVEVVDAFVDDAPAKLAELRRGADEGDATLVGRAAHTLKSNGLTFGALELAGLCRQLEAAAQSDELAGSAELIDRVDVQWARVRRELTELRDGEG